MSKISAVEAIQQVRMVKAPSQHREETIRGQKVYVIESGTGKDLPEQEMLRKEKGWIRASEGRYIREIV